MTFGNVPRNLNRDPRLRRASARFGESALLVGANLAVEGGLIELDNFNGFTTDDLAEGASNLYFTDERAQDAVGGILADSATIDFTYNDATPSISADVKDGSITFAKMQAVSADVLLGNDAAGTAVEEITCTAAGRALLDDADASAQRTTLGLGTSDTPVFAGMQIGDSGFGSQTLDVVGTGIGGTMYLTSAAGRFQYLIRKARGTAASPSAVVDGDACGLFAFQGYDGSAFQQPAQIQATVDGTVSAGAVPMRLSFVTGTNASDRAERLQVKSDGTIRLTYDSTNYVDLVVSSAGVLTVTANGSAPQFTFANGVQCTGLAIGTTPTANMIDLVGGSGILRTSNTDSDSTNKQARWGTRHYTNAEEDFFGILFIASASHNDVLYGGGSGVGNAATRLSFYTAANSTTTTGTRRGRVDPDGNFLWGTATSPGGTHGIVIVLGDNAGDPTMGADTAGLYAKDVAGTVELFAMDEGDVATQLSEHAGDAPSWLYDNDGFPERVSRVVDPYTAQIEWVNRSRMEKLMELLIAGKSMPTGDAAKIRHRESFAAYNTRMGYSEGDRRALVAKDWNAVQTAKEAARNAQIAEWDAWVAKKAAAEAAGAKFDEIRPHNERPPVYVKKPAPARLTATNKTIGGTI